MLKLTETLAAALITRSASREREAAYTASREADERALQGADLPPRRTR